MIESREWYTTVWLLDVEGEKRKDDTGLHNYIKESCCPFDEKFASVGPVADAWPRGFQG